jgi:ADP-dependent NAD(P)H-hydrate dehydratase
MPLPRLTGEVDKNARGSVLVVGGSPVAPGAIILAARAALRVGAGRAQIAIPKSLGISAGLVFFECGVCAFSETPKGNPAATAAAEIIEKANCPDVIAIGPGLMDGKSATALTLNLLKKRKGPTFVIDALAMVGLWNCQAQLHQHKGKIILTPHAGEMALLSGLAKENINREPVGVARNAAQRLSSVIVLKGSTTIIAAPDGSSYGFHSATSGLATAGSGDVLTGLISGIAARGVPALHAAIWGVYLHATGGARLARRHGAIGFLASEIDAEIPSLLDKTMAS